MTSGSANLRGAGLLTLTMLLFASSDAVMKTLFARLPVGEVAFLRGCVILLILVPVAFWRGLHRTWRAQLHPTVLLRAVLEVTVAYAYFYALSKIPLANAVILLFASPIAMTALAAFWLKERVDPARWAAVIVGFLGVLLIVRPTAEGWNLGALFGALSAILVSFRDLGTRTIPPTADSLGIAIVSGAAVLAAGAATLPFAWTTPTAGELGLVLLGGAIISIAYVTVIMSFRIGEISFVAPFRYVSVPLAILIGWLVFGEVPARTATLGMAIVLAAGLYIFLRERRASRARG